jgi:hypothetical protein
VAYREFRDREGTPWEVWEVRPSAVERRLNEDRRRENREHADRRELPEAHIPMPPKLRDGWLVFQCGDQKRRLAPIPMSWTLLSDEGLEKLAGKAQPLDRQLHTTQPGRPGGGAYQIDLLPGDSTSSGSVPGSTG